MTTLSSDGQQEEARDLPQDLDTVGQSVSPGAGAPPAPSAPTVKPRPTLSATVAASCADRHEHHRPGNAHQRHHEHLGRQRGPRVEENAQGQTFSQNRFCGHKTVPSDP